MNLPPALSRDVLFGMNVVTLLGFVAMGIGLNQSRAGRARVPFAFAMMGVGTVLVFLGLYLSHTTA